MNHSRIARWRSLLPCILSLTLANAAPAAPPVPFRAGAATIDVSPPKLPAIIAGMFTERVSDQLTDRLHARCIVMDDGKTKLALVIVDTCMMKQKLIDEAKELASKQCGIPVDHMMVSATHTHSAPAAMACLGTRLDKNYAAFLPGKIAEGIVAATKALQPAKIGWSSVDDWEHTHNRRWIRQPGKEVVDPFGNATGRANMHPGYLSADIIGPSGPVDPQLSVISIQTKDGKPLAVLANYSQHYFGSAGISSDYYGLFCKHIARMLDQPGDGNGPFVCAMSQGTSGDLMWMDYGAPKKTFTTGSYAEAVAKNAMQALKSIVHHDSVPLAIVEKKLALNYRVPDAKRLEWARPIAAKIENGLAKDKQEVYAMEALILHELQHTEVKLQAIRIGDLSITTLPNEVYAITGLKLKAQSPLASHFNIELANGAEGYIPPPEQHALGGYTTWPARTAGLEVQAEPKMIETLLGALEEATGGKRRAMKSDHGAYAQAVFKAKPVACWRLDDAAGRVATNAVEGGAPAKVFDGAAWYLPGVGSGTGYGDGEALKPSAFSGDKQINRALHTAGGKVEAELPGLHGKSSIALWFWLGHDSGASERAGTLIDAFGTSLHAHQLADHTVKLELGNVVSTFVGTHSQVPAKVETTFENNAKLTFGNGIEGRLDEITIWDRAIEPALIAQLWKTSRIEEENSAHAQTRKLKPASPPLSPEESLKKLHVRAGFKAELIACEPVVLDPVAFDWDEHGRLWVVEMADYPLGMDGKGRAGGRVVMLEDTNADDLYDKRTVIANGLNFPTGILCWRDGVLVTAAPDVLFIKGGEKKVLLTGFSEGNQQLRVNGLRWGMDGWVYCAGGAHTVNYNKTTSIESKLTGQKIELGSRDFRFKPDTGELDPQTGPSQFGRVRDDWDHWFGVQNSRPLWHYVLQDHYLRRNPNVIPPDPIKLMYKLNPPVYAASAPEKRFHSFDHATAYTSACGIGIYRGGTLFDDGKMHAFTCEPFHNLVQHHVMEDDGVSFKAHTDTDGKMPDFFASEDRWCRPVMVRDGPDGAIYIADMYRYMIEHPQWLPQNGKDELLPFYRDGDDKGRIWRVSKVTGTLVPAKKDAAATEVAATLASPIGWQRDKAQMLIAWSQPKDIDGQLIALAGDGPTPQARAQAAWTLQLLGKMTPRICERLLIDPSPRVREQGLILAENFADDAALMPTITAMTHDADAKVRLQLANSLSVFNDERAGAALAALMLRDAKDASISGSVLISAASHVAALLNPEVIAGLDATGLASVTRLVMKTNDESLTARLMEVAGVSGDKGSMQRLRSLINALTGSDSSLDQLARTAQKPELKTQLIAINQLVALTAARLNDPKHEPAANDADAVAVLAMDAAHSKQMLDLAQRWIKASGSSEAQRIATVIISSARPKDAVEMLTGEWVSRTPQSRHEIVEALLANGAWTKSLLKLVKSGAVAAISFDARQRASLLQHPNKAIAADAAALFQNSSTPTRAAVLGKFKPALSLNGDAARGKQMFTATGCIACHQLDGAGLPVGPDLRSVVQHTPEKLFDSILDPSAVIEPGFAAYHCTLKSGEQLYGIVATETGGSLTMKLAGNIMRSVLRSEISELKATQTSLMPDGLEVALTPQSLADLITYLQSPKQ